MSVEDTSQHCDGFPADWPRAGDKAFVEVHPFRGTWAAKRTDERLYRMIKGFHEAGDLLVEESEAEPHRGLNLLYPAIFNYRQSLELRLKYLLIAYGPQAGEEPDYREHGLQKLWTKCRRMIFSFEANLQISQRDALQAVDAVIDEFDAVDPRSDAFRFAHDTKGRSVKLSVTEIDLRNLKNVMMKVHNFLECADLHLHYGHGVDRCAH